SYQAFTSRAQASQSCQRRNTEIEVGQSRLKGELAFSPRRDAPRPFAPVRCPERLASAVSPSHRTCHCSSPRNRGESTYKEADLERRFFPARSCRESSSEPRA